MTNDMAKDILRRKYNLEVIEIRELKSHWDQNFYVKALPIPHESSRCHHDLDRDSNVVKSFVLKIVGVEDDIEDETSKLSHQFNFMKFLRQCKFVVPEIIETVLGETIFVETVSSSFKCHVFLLSYIDGITVYDKYSETVTPPHILHKLGQMLADWHTAVQSFDGVQYEPTAWRLDNTSDFTERLSQLEDKDKVALSKKIISAFESEVTQHIPKLETGMTHGDFHDENVVVLKNPASSSTLEFGIIDFGDTGVAPYLFDLATSVAFFMMTPSKDSGRFLEAGGHFLAGYVQRHPLTELEWRCLYLSVCMAYVRELVVGESDYITQGESNAYLLTSCEIGWSQLEDIWNCGQTVVLEQFQKNIDHHTHSKN